MLMVVWVVLMIIWLLFGCYGGYTWGDPAGRPGRIGGSLLAWFCVLILGIAIFGTGLTTMTLPR